MVAAFVIVLHPSRDYGGPQVPTFVQRPSTLHRHFSCTVWVKKIPPGVFWHFPQTTGIFSPHFTNLLYVLIYAILQILIQLPATLTKLYAILSATTRLRFGRWWTRLIWGRARSVHDHFGTSCVPISVHRYRLLRYISMTISEHRVIRLRYTDRSEYGQFRYIHFGTLSNLRAY